MGMKSVNFMHRVYIETTNSKDDKKTNEFRFFEYLLTILNLEAEIVGIGGKRNLVNFEANFKDTNLRGYKNLVIIDADGAHNTENWSLQNEFNKIEELRSRIDVNFELFFLPNNHDEGDFEKLLEKTINQKHYRVIDCHIRFEDCIKHFAEYVTPNQKARIYSYISSFPMSHKKEESFKNKGDWFFSNAEYWDFNSSSLQPLKDFLISHLS